MQLSLYDSPHFQAWGILTVMTSESATVSDFRPRVIFAVSWHRICYLTKALIDKTVIAFNLCYHKNSLPCLLYKWKHIWML